jgi:MYXO-CTERM domain-containing protein
MGLAAIWIAAVLLAPAAGAQSQLPGLGSWQAYPWGDGARVSLAGGTSCNRPGRLVAAFRQDQALVIHIGSGIPPGQGCGFAFVPWHLEADFPNLPAGDYEVVAINYELYLPIAPLEVLRFDYQHPALGLPTAVGVPAGSRTGWLVLAALMAAGLLRRRARISL